MLQPSKLARRVRFPSPAPLQKPPQNAVLSCCKAKTAGLHTWAGCRPVFVPQEEAFPLLFAAPPRKPFHLRQHWLESADVFSATASGSTAEKNLDWGHLYREHGFSATGRRAVRIRNAIDCDLDIPWRRCPCRRGLDGSQDGFHTGGPVSICNHFGLSVAECNSELFHDGRLPSISAFPSHAICRGTAGCWTSGSGTMAVGDCENDWQT